VGTLGEIGDVSMDDHRKLEQRIGLLGGRHCVLVVRCCSVVTVQLLHSAGSRLGDESEFGPTVIGTVVSLAKIVDLVMSTTPPYFARPDGFAR
jgi:hypothetical protein